MLAKVFPIMLKPGMQAEAEAVVHEFAPQGPGQEGGTLAFRASRDSDNTAYLMLVEHCADSMRCSGRTVTEQ